MLGGKIVVEKWRFYRQETRGKTESPEWNGWNSFKEGHVQNRTPNEVALTTVSKLSLEQVHEKQSLETPEMAKKKKFTPGQGSPPSNVQLVSNLYRRTKALRWKGDGMIIFSWINAPNILFQLPNLKNYIFEGSKWLLHTRW